SEVVARSLSWGEHSTPAAMVEKKSSKKKERKKLEVGKYVDSEKIRYIIDSVLGSGGFGDVYKVHPTNDKKLHYAMKTEFFDPEKRKLLNRLKVEMSVFSEIQKCTAPIDKSCFVEMVDKGKTEKFKFIVMEIVSHSLIDISKNMMKNIPTSPSTNIQIARQTLRAIEAFHIVGYIHRDIKPHNFAIGRPPKDSKIYMLDFGIARRYVEPNGKLRIPRSRVRFLGTVKFASIGCHKELEQSRKDDLEVWCYMMLEYFNKDNLTWRRVTDRPKICDLKAKVMSNPKSSDLKMPKAFVRAVEMVHKMTFTCVPDYPALHTILDDIVKAEQIDESAKLDWIGKTMDTATKQKKTAIEKLENDDDSDERRKRDEKEKKRREVSAKKRKLEEELAQIYKDTDERKTPEQIRAEIRAKMRKVKDEERRRRREREREEEEDDDDDDSEDDYSEDDDTRVTPRQKSKLLSVQKTMRDEPSRSTSKYSGHYRDEPSLKRGESRKKKTRRPSREDDIDDDLERQSRDRHGRKKESRKRSTYGKVNSRLERLKTEKRLRRSRMEKPPESPPRKGEPLETHSFNDYIALGTAKDMEKDADAKDKKAEA
ncbi:hypothetical protein PFISCL1PPCAC_17409, partial [Pristionchus fissidentatus]